MPNLRGWEILILLAIVLVLFGSKKLPDAARGIGRSLRIFKAETKGLMDDDKAAGTTQLDPPTVTPAVPPTIDEQASQVSPGEPTEQHPSPPSGRPSA